MADGNYVRIVAACTHDKPLFPTTGRARKACFDCWPAPTKRPIQWTEVVEAVCASPGCGRTFSKRRPRERFCCDKCRNRVNNRKKLARRTADGFGNTGHRRRARKFGVSYEPINRRKVFERDGWHCKLCGRRTPRSKQGTTLLDAPELDHIVPMSRGGPHLYTNVQCVCRACNAAKGARPMGQLLLVG